MEVLDGIPGYIGSPLAVLGFYSCCLGSEVIFEANLRTIDSSTKGAGCIMGWAGEQ